MTVDKEKARDYTLELKLETLYRRLLGYLNLGYGSSMGLKSIAGLVTPDCG